jgi:putative cell wall-binding protein
LAYIQAIIRPIHYTAHKKTPTYSSPYTNPGKIAHSLKTNIKKLVKNSIKLDEENNCILKNKNVLNMNLIKNVGSLKFYVVCGEHYCFMMFYDVCLTGMRSLSQVNMWNTV